MYSKERHTKYLFKGRGAGASFDLGTLSGLFLTEQPDKEIKSNPAKTVTKILHPTAKQVHNAKAQARLLVSNFARETLSIAKGIRYDKELYGGSFVMVRNN